MDPIALPDNAQRLVFYAYYPNGQGPGLVNISLQGESHLLKLSEMDIDDFSLQVL